MVETLTQIPETTPDGDFAIQQFRQNYPDAPGVGEFYNSLTPAGYEEWARRVNFNETGYVADEVIRLSKDASTGITTNSAVFDAGAGTGVLGKKISEQGFNNIVGCDASSRFFEHLTAEGVYKQAKTLMMGQGEEAFPEEFRCKYDIVTACGVFLKSHMPCDAMDDCVTALKPNGYFVTAMRSCYWKDGEAEGYKDKLDSLVAQGKLTLVNTFTFMRGNEGDEGLFAPQESRLVCYQKTAAQ